MKNIIWLILGLTLALAVFLLAVSFFPSTATLSVTNLNLAAEETGNKISPSPITIDFRNPITGASKREPWAARAKSKWLRLKPEKGRGRKVIYVNLWAFRLLPGIYRDKIIFFNPQTGKTWGEVDVKLIVLGSGATRPPFGHIDSPEDGARVSIRGFYPTGWALDDIEVISVELEGEKVKSPEIPGDEKAQFGEAGFILLGRAGFFEGTRPDVASAFTEFPFNHRAGWSLLIVPPPGFQRGDKLKIHFFIQDKEGNRVKLGERIVILE